MDRERTEHGRPKGLLGQRRGIGLLAVAACCPLLFSACTTPLGSGVKKPPAAAASPATKPATARTAPADGKGTAVSKAASPAATPPATASGLVQPAGYAEPDPTPRSPADPAVDTAKQWTVQDVLQWALQYHPILRVREHEVQAARAKLITARLLPNPQFVLTTDTAIEGLESEQLTGRLTFTIPTGPKRLLRTAVAETAVRESQWAMSREVKLLLAEAADAAIEVLYLQEVLYQQRHTAALAKQAAEIQRERFKAAAVPYRIVVLAELAAGNADLAQQGSVTRLEQAQLRLSRAMGLNQQGPPQMLGQVTVEPIPPIPMNTVMAEARRVAPEMAQSQAALLESQQRLALQRWMAVPDLTLGPRLTGPLGGAGDHGVGARFSVDVPIFDRNQGNIAESAAQIQVNCARLQVAEITTLADVGAVYLELKDVQARWEYYTAHARPLMEKTEVALREAFRDQSIAAYELVNLLEELARMERSDVDLRYQHHRLRARMEILLERRLADLAAEPVPAPAAAAPAPAAKK